MIHHLSDPSTVELCSITLVIRPLCGLMFNHLSDPSTLWTLFVESDNPRRLIRPSFGLDFVSVHLVEFSYFVGNCNDIQVENQS